MRGQDGQTSSMFSYVDMEDRVPAHHPLRKICEFVNAALAALDAEFAKLYSADGRPSIAPERLLRAALIQILFSIRSERQLMEQMQYNLLFRWFVGLGIDDPVWVPTVFTKNRDRLLNTDIARKVLAAILAHRDVAPLLSDEHFSVDGTLIEAWASMKSFQPKDRTEGSEPPAAASGGTGQACAGAQACEAAAPAETPVADKGRNAEVNFHGQKRSNETHASVTDPDARLYRKGEGKEAKLCYMGHALMENRNGLVVEACLTHADGHAERNAALAMIEPRADRPVREAKERRCGVYGDFRSFSIRGTIWGASLPLLIRQAQAAERSRFILRPARDTFRRRRRKPVFVSQCLYKPGVAIRPRQPPPSSSGTPCRQPICGA